MRILMTGTNGQVGFELLRAFAPANDIIAAPRERLDLAKPHAIRELVRETKPELIINAAAYTAVDRAESEPESARAINAMAVGVIGEEARRINTPVIHYSTDYVFDGTKRTPYQPGDRPNPQSVYGRTKLEGERALAESGASYIVLRTCWVYAMRGRNFVLAILKNAKEKPELRVVNDQTGSPTWCRLIAKATAQIVRTGLKNRSFEDRQGVYHYACSGSTTWHEFAQYILQLENLSNSLTPISTADYGAPAPRPAYSVLDCSQTVETFGTEIVAWRQAYDSARQDAAINSNR